MRIEQTFRSSGKLFFLKNHINLVSKEISCTCKAIDSIKNCFNTQITYNVLFGATHIPIDTKWRKTKYRQTNKNILEYHKSLNISIWLKHRKIVCVLIFDKYCVFIALTILCLIKQFDKNKRSENNRFTKLFVWMLFWY